MERGQEFFPVLYDDQGNIKKQVSSIAYHKKLRFMFLIIQSAISSM